MTGHTLGPWRISSAKPTRSRGIDILAGHAKTVASVPISRYTSEPTHDADAHLISAAPDLLAAARRALNVLKSQGESVRPGNVLGALDAAIAKAEGKTP